MQSSYHILFSVALKHNYFAGNKLEGIGITPSPETLHFFNRSGLLFKPFKDGFTVLYDALFAGRTRERQALLDNRSMLRFYMTLNDGNFYNYTSAFTKNPVSSLFYFHNMAGHLNHAFLHSGAAVGDASLRQVPRIREAFFVKPFGLLDIKLLPGLEQDYSIQFREKETYWRYHIVSEHLKRLNSPAVLRGDGVFEGPVKTLLPDRREAITFSSREPIGLSEFHKDFSQLVENFEAGSSGHKIIMRALPAPDIRSLSLISSTAEKDKASYSEIFI